MYPIKASKLRLTSGYGKRTYTYKGKKVTDFHYGNDLTADPKDDDAEILAFDSGTVTAVRKTGAQYGAECYVRIAHANGWYTLYCHFKSGSITVNKGDKVKKGQKIGIIGKTGQATGIHLHFQIDKGSSSTAINPYDYVFKDKQLPSDDKNYTGTITYQAYSNGKWLSEVSKCSLLPNGYAGNKGSAIQGLRAKPQYGEITIESHIKGGKWLSAISSKNYSKSSNNGNTYSGLIGKSIDGIKIKSTKGYVTYRVHLKGGKWLDWVKSTTTTGSNSYAGIFGKEIDMIQMK